MKVVARSSSFKYKGQVVDPQEAAKALNVEAILTGRVTRRGESLIISAELVDTRDKTQVWGEQFNRQSSDLLQVQAEISRHIAESLRMRLTAVERQQFTKRETVNLVAYELLLKGRFHSNGPTESQKKAIEYCKQAIDVDPDYALAYATLSLNYSGLINVNVLDPKEFMPKAEMAARKALELDESLPEAHLAMSDVYIYDWKWAEAERELKRAIELNPNLAAAHTGYMFYLIIQGRKEEAIAEGERAKELDPLSAGVNAAYVYRLLLVEQYDKALEIAKKLLEAEPNNPQWHELVGYVYASKGQYAEAIAPYQESIKLGNDSQDIQLLLGEAYAKVGELEKTRELLKRLETGNGYVSPYVLALFHSALGEKEQAFAFLERSYAIHDQQLIWLGIEEKFAPLYDDPRYNNLLHRIGLPQRK